MCQASRAESAHDLKRVCIKIRPQLRPAQRRECEHASSKVAATQLEEISPPQRAQMRWPQPCASAALGRQLTATAAAHQQYQCGRCLPLLSPTKGSMHKPEPSVLLARCVARYQARLRQSRNRIIRMLLSRQRQTHESLLQHGRRAPRPRDMGWAHPGYSACGFPLYATRRAQDRWEQRYKGCSRAAAHGRPIRMDKFHNLYRGASPKKEEA